MKEGTGTDRRQSQRSIRKARTSPRLESFISQHPPPKSSFIRPRNPLYFNECQPIPTRAGGRRTGRSALPQKGRAVLPRSPIIRHARPARDEKGIVKPSARSITLGLSYWESIAVKVDQGGSRE